MVPLKTSDIFRLLCIQYKVVSVEYFMNEMQPWEAEEILGNLEYTDSLEWERCRLLLHAQISLFAKHPKDIHEILKFPWEKDLNGGPLETEISDEDIERLREKSKKIVTKYNAL